MGTQAIALWVAGCIVCPLPVASGDEEGSQLRKLRCVLSAMPGGGRGWVPSWQPQRQLKPAAGVSKSIADKRVAPRRAGSGSGASKLFQLLRVQSG